MSHQAAQRRARILGTAAVAGVHAYLGTIGLFDRLNYTVPSEYRLLHLAADAAYWVPIHLGTAALLLVGLLMGPRWTKTACHFSFAMLTVWTFFNLLWGISTVRPVSLAIPGLAAFVALGAHILAGAWLRQERPDKDR